VTVCDGVTCVCTLAQVRMIWAGRELKDDRRSLREMGMPSNCVVHITKRVQVPARCVLGRY
jgi:hypothetical protein